MDYLPRQILWPLAKERPKTLYLKLGLEELGVPIQDTSKWMKAFKPPENRLGPYVYPIMLDYGERKQLIFYDIGTMPGTYYSQYFRHVIYFKTHIRKKDRNQFPHAIVAPNSCSKMEYLDLLPTLRHLKNRKEYEYDFMFIGWNDDRGLRMATIRKARQMRIRKLAYLMPFKHHTVVEKPYDGPRLPYMDHLTIQARTKLNLALPGGFQLPYCSFRHVELWGMGACVLTCPCDAVLPGNPKGIWVEYNLDNLQEQIRYYLKHDEEREEIAAKGRQYFEDFLTPKANASWILYHAAKRMMK